MTTILYNIYAWIETLCGNVLAGMETWIMNASAGQLSFAILVFMVLIMVLFTAGEYTTATYEDEED